MAGLKRTNCSWNSCSMNGRPATSGAWNSQQTPSHAGWRARGTRQASIRSAVSGDRSEPCVRSHRALARCHVPSAADTSLSFLVAALVHSDAIRRQLLVVAAPKPSDGPIGYEKHHRLVACQRPTAVGAAGLLESLAGHGRCAEQSSARKGPGLAPSTPCTTAQQIKRLNLEFARGDRGKFERREVPFCTFFRQFFFMFF